MVDVRTLALANLAVQILLVITVSCAAYLAKKKKLTRHCTVMRIAVPVQIIAILAVMLPSMLGYISIGSLTAEMLAHHTLGVVVIALWIYINLVYGKPYMPRNLALFMRSAFLLWMLAFILGVYLYSSIYGL